MRNLVPCSLLLHLPGRVVMKQFTSASRNHCTEMGCIDLMMAAFTDERMEI